MISSFDFKAAQATNGQRVLMIETLETENQWSLTPLITLLKHYLVHLTSSLNPMKIFFPTHFLVFPFNLVENDLRIVLG